jgi:acetate---CoA ligase (ADP-forming)
LAGDAVVDRKRGVTGAQLLQTLLQPRSVAIIGASDTPSKASGRTLAYLRRYGYQGAILPVNAARATVQGVPAYASIDVLPETPDLAVIVLPATSVPQAVVDCGRKGIPSAIVFASGYAETGPEGQRAQEQLIRVAREAGVRILGPNCIGTVGAASGLTATFMTGLDQDRFALEDDGIAFVTQSGAMGGFILNMAQSTGVGVGRFVSTGNEADVTFEEVLAALVEDPAVRVILGYVEGIRDPDRFRGALARARDRGVPVALLKVGRSARGASAAQSHTGALVGSDTVYDGLFAQYGVFRPTSIEELMDLGRALSTSRRPSGRRLTIVTLSGGAGALMTDAADELGLHVEPWEREWSDRLRAVLPAFASVTNPIDTTGALAADVELLRPTLATCLEHPGTDIAVVLVGNLEREEDAVVDILVAGAATSRKPLVVVWVGGSGRPVLLLSRAGIPAFTDPVRAARAIAAMVAGATGRPLRGLATPPVGAESASVASAGGTVLDEVEVKRLLKSAGVAVVDERACAGPEDAVAAADVLGYPVVLKLLSQEVPHKSDRGYVLLGLGNPGEVRDAATAMQGRARAEGVSDVRLVVQQLVRSDTELILGMRVDETFGPVIALGLGGVLAEVLGDVQVRVPPIDRADVVSMIEGLRGRALLDGARGRPAVDLERLADAVLGFSQFVCQHPGEYASLEVNPLVVRSDGSVVAVDGLAIRTDRS